MFWLIVGAVVFVGFALAWWSSGRAKPRTSITPEEAIRRTQGEVATYDAGQHLGPAGGGYPG